MFYNNLQAIFDIFKFTYDAESKRNKTKYILSMNLEFLLFYSPKPRKNFDVLKVACKELYTWEMLTHLARFVKLNFSSGIRFARSTRSPLRTHSARFMRMHSFFLETLFLCMRVLRVQRTHSTRIMRMNSRICLLGVCVLHWNAFSSVYKNAFGNTLLSEYAFYTGMHSAPFRRLRPLFENALGVCVRHLKLMHSASFQTMRSYSGICSSLRTDP